MNNEDHFGVHSKIRVIPAFITLLGNIPLSLVPELTHIQAVVDALPCKELFVGSALHHLAFLHHNHLIGAGDRRKTVGDDEARASLHQLMEAPLDEQLGTGIDGAGRLIQD